MNGADGEASDPTAAMTSEGGEAYDPTAGKRRGNGESSFPVAGMRRGDGNASGPTAAKRRGGDGEFSDPTIPFRVVAFASGSGSNFEALAEYESPGRLWRVVGLVSNRGDAGAIGRARRLGIPATVVPTRGRDEDRLVQATLAALDALRADVVCLAGYLRLLPASVVDRFRGRILNIHPALLPKFGGRGMYGIRVHEAVLAAAEKTTGVTVHHVSEEYDRGPVLIQKELVVRGDDTPHSLASRVLREEHRLYPRAVELLCNELHAQRIAVRTRVVGARSQGVGVRPCCP